MHCSDKLAIGMFGSLYFIAVVTFSLIIPPLADKKSIGRRKIVICASLTHQIAVLVQISTKSLTVAYVCSFALGACMPGRVFVGYIWMTEFFNKK